MLLDFFFGGGVGGSFMDLVGNRGVSRLQQSVERTIENLRPMKGGAAGGGS